MGLLNLFSNLFRVPDPLPPEEPCSDGAWYGPPTTDPPDPPPAPPTEPRVYGKGIVEDVHIHTIPLTDDEVKAMADAFRAADREMSAIEKPQKVKKPKRATKKKPTKRKPAKKAKKPAKKKPPRKK